MSARRSYILAWPSLCCTLQLQLSKPCSRKQSSNERIGHVLSFSLHFVDKGDEFRKAMQPSRSLSAASHVSQRERSNTLSSATKLMMSIMQGLANANTSNTCGIPLAKQW